MPKIDSTRRPFHTAAVTHASAEIAFDADARGKLEKILFSKKIAARKKYSVNCSRVNEP